MGVALVTGADGGIGSAISERLLDDGHSLAFATRERTKDGLERCRRLGERGRVHLVAGDLADPTVPARIVEDATEALGPIDILVKNAGISPARPFLDLSARDFDRIFAVDVRAAFLLSREVASSMRGRGGVIVNVTSVHEDLPREGLALYAAAKAALGMLTRGMALELAPHGIRVNAVAPGVIATPGNADAREMAGEVPLARAGESRDVAALIGFLVSDEARYVTGASLLVDGGLSQAVIRRNAAR